VDFETAGYRFMTNFAPGLKDLTDRLTGRQVVVLGDLVADRFVYGRTKRVSREAPVLILEYERDRFTLGGAANAIHNLCTLGARPIPIGVVGKDSAGDAVLARLDELGVDRSGIVVDSSRPTTTKERFLGSGLHTMYQQILRIDRGYTRPVEPAVEKALLSSLEKLSKKNDVIVVSDYGYGTLTDNVIRAVNRIAGSGESKVLVDSRYRMTQFRRPALTTPNEPEAEAAAGMQIRLEIDAVDAAKRLLDSTEAEAICITRGNKGMYLRKADGADEMIPIFGSDQIADVTGAGDTVMAVFAAALSAGDIPLVEAAQMATVAAGIVVMKNGTATVTQQEIKDALTRAEP
jgi:D-glycero-beta-D-manno-heptose-7-phosphate kinase